MSSLRGRAYKKNPFMTFLATHGIKHERGGRSLKNEFAPDRIVMVSGYGPVFKKFGLELDELLLRAIESGYLPPDSEEGDLYGLIQQAISGERIEPLYTHGSEDSLLAQYEARREMEEEDMGWETEAEYYGMSEEEFSALVAPMTDEELLELEEDSNFDWDAPVSCIMDQAEAMRELGFTEEEIAALTAPANEKTITPISCISVQPAPVFQNQEAEGVKTATIEPIRACNSTNLVATKPRAPMRMDDIPVCFRSSPPPEYQRIGIRPPIEGHAEHPINPTPPSRTLARDGDFPRYPASCISTKINHQRKESDMERPKTQEPSAAEKYRAALMKMPPEQRKRAHRLAMQLRGMESKIKPTNSPPPKP